MSSDNNLFIAWNPFQRRVESLATLLDLRIRYFHCDWEQHGRIFKFSSYIVKITLTVCTLVRHRPRYIFLQLPPTILLYVVAVYSMFTRSRYVADCHNGMIYDHHWIKWPFAKMLLRRSYMTLTHNEDVREIARQINIYSTVLRDPLPVIDVANDVEEVAGIRLRSTAYVIVPWGMAIDEPVYELFEAASYIPDTLFVMTWFKEGLPAALRMKAPKNLVFTGYLKERHFSALFAAANASLVLTTREGTQPSGAAEAIALGIPLVVSDICTTRRLYGEAAIFVQNKPKAIASGVKLALEDAEKSSVRISGLRSKMVDDVYTQINYVKRKMVTQDS